MEVGDILVFIFLVFLFLSCCGYCCSSKRRGAVLSTPVVVTTATPVAPVNYPVTSVPTSATGGYQTNAYAAPYPTQMPPTVQMPMPAPREATGAPIPGFHNMMQPYGQMPLYPPINQTTVHSGTAACMNPPTYDMAVGQPSANTCYQKQAAYNPNFVAH